MNRKDSSTQMHPISQGVMKSWDILTGCACFLCQIDLETIKDMYLEKYDVSLKDALRSECSGDFKRLLLEILH